MASKKPQIGSKSAQMKPRKMFCHTFSKIQSVEKKLVQRTNYNLTNEPSTRSFLPEFEPKFRRIDFGSLILI